MTPIDIRLAEYRLAQSRCKPGKAVRRAYPWASDAQVQDVAAYIKGDYDVEITSSPAVWADAYAAIRSCMQGKGDLCARAYTPHGVQIAVLRNAGGDIVARALVRDGLAHKAYGASAYILVAALEVLGGVTITPGWLDEAEGWIETQVEEPEPDEVWISVPAYDYIAHLWVGGRWVAVDRGTGVPLEKLQPSTPERWVYARPAGYTVDVRRPNLRKGRRTTVWRPYVDR